MHTVGFTWRLLLDLDINSRGRAAQHSCCKRTNEQGKSSPGSTVFEVQYTNAWFAQSGPEVGGGNIQHIGLPQSLHLEAKEIELYELVKTNHAGECTLITAAALCMECGRRDIVSP